jgi:hypothetical protein
MLSMQEMSDRLEIQDLFTRYCYAIDGRDWDALDAMFTPDARIDYTATGGAAGSLSEMKAWLGGALAPFAMSQHMVALPNLVFDGDSASSRMILFNPMGMDDGEGNIATFFCGVWYHDKLVRTEAGWRIAERAQQLAYMHSTPNAKGFRSV